MEKEELDQVLEQIDKTLNSLTRPKLIDDRVAIECYILRIQNMIMDIRAGSDFEHFQKLWRVGK